jgi:hypothetical protein
MGDYYIPKLVTTLTHHCLKQYDLENERTLSSKMAYKKKLPHSSRTKSGTQMHASCTTPIAHYYDKFPCPSTINYLMWSGPILQHILTACFGTLNKSKQFLFHTADKF